MKKLLYTLLIMLMALPVKAEEKESNWDLKGILYLTGTNHQNYDFEPYFAEQGSSDSNFNTTLRLMANYSNDDNFSAEFHSLSSAVVSTDDFAEPQKNFKYKYFDWTHIDHNDDKAFTTLIDRANFIYSHDKFDLILGRQAITYGKAFFWNLLDVFNPFDPANVIRSYKTGVDAVKLDIPLGDFSGLDLMYVPTKVSGSVDSDQSAVLAHYYTSYKGWDVSAQIGEVYAGAQIGFGITGDAKGFEFRAEATHFEANDLLDIDDYDSFILGTGYRFDNTLHLEAEYFRNGAGTSNESELTTFSDNYLANGISQNLSRDLLAFSASYEFLPIVVGRMSAIVSLNDGSVLLQPDLEWSVSDNIVFKAIANINIGDRPRDNAGTAELRSEFGSYADTYLAQLKVYF